MNFISYAPNFEDVMLWRALRHLPSGFYLDVGAGAPQHGSVTQAFYERGWRGINLEPAAAPHALLAAARPADINLAVLAVARATPGEALLFDAGDSGRSSTDATQADACRHDGLTVLRRGVAASTLDALCAAHADAVIHFINLAVNGAELAVLQGLDLARWQPWIVLVRQGADDGAIAAHMAAAGYQLAYADGQKRYYVAASQPALAAALALPPHAADQFILAEDHHYAWPLAAWRQRTHSAEQALSEHQAWLATHQQGWSERLAHTEAQRSQLEAAHGQAEQARQAAVAERDRIWNELSTALHATVARAEQAEAHGARVQAELLGIYASLAWRLARPIRGLVKLARYVRQRWWQCRSAALRAVRTLRSAITGGVRGSARRAVGFVLARPALASFVLRQLGRFPRVHQLLRTLARRSQAPAAAVPVAADAAHLRQLPPATRQAYHELQQALQRARH